MTEAPFVLAHHPEPSASGYVLAGHLHPGVRLAGPGDLRATLPCFWFADRVGVLPVCGEFTGLAHPVWSTPSGYGSPSNRRAFVEFASGVSKWSFVPS